MFALLAANIFIKKNNIETEEYLTKEITLQFLDDKFKNTLYDLGLDSTWIQPKKNQRNENVNYYTVNVPTDLPITVVIQELQNKFSNDSIIVISNEKRINGNSEIIINNKEEFQISADFIYNKTIERKGNSFSFLISDFENISKQKQDELLSILEPFGIILLPSKENISVSELIKNFRKEVILLFNDEVRDIQYKIPPRYSEQRLRGIVVGVNTNYKAASFLIYDESSVYSNNKSAEYLINRFKINKINYLSSKYFENFSEEIKLQNHSPGKYNKIFIITTAQFNSIIEEIKSLKKKGNKILNPSEFITKYFN